MKPLLILFDIDGTLITHVGDWKPSQERFRRAIEEVFGVTPEFNERYDGLVDKQINWMLVKNKGISREDFETKFPQIRNRLHELALEQSQSQQMYQPIKDAKVLIEALQIQKIHLLGLMTGNVEKMGWWKLEHAGYEKFTDFGIFGDEVDNRVLLAQTAIPKAEIFFKRTFTPRDVVVIGDSVNDIKCARAIGAHIIAVATGGHNVDELKQEKPDLLVDSLSDKRVFSFFNLSKLK